MVKRDFKANAFVAAGVSAESEREAGGGFHDGGGRGIIDCLAAKHKHLHHGGLVRSLSPVEQRSSTTTIISSDNSRERERAKEEQQ